MTDKERLDWIERHYAEISYRTGRVLEMYGKYCEDKFKEIDPEEEGGEWWIRHSRLTNPDWYTIVSKTALRGDTLRESIDKAIEFEEE